MILVTGGTGFIGSHTVAALLDLGEECVVVSRRAGVLPPTLEGRKLAVEQGDVADLGSLRALGRRHRITGIVHLAGSYPSGEEAAPVEAASAALQGLFNVVQVAEEWGVDRVGVASTIGVYSGVGATGALGEDLPLPMGAPHAIPTFKKIGEMLGGHLADATGLSVVNYRISATWGPLGHTDPFFAAPALVHAAARGAAPDLTPLLVTPHADDALDLCYVKDTARAVALLQLADGLEHRTYNVGAGRATSNAEIAAALRAVVPDADVDLPASGATAAPDHLDITRLRADTGYAPAYDTEQAVADYVAWLRAGHER